jgi:outer membrane immunogenic protein
MLRNILMTSVAFAVISGSALAADLPGRSMAPMAYAPPVFTWTGLYIGGSAGYMRANTKANDIDDDFTGGSTDISSDGGIFGLNIGYNWQLSGPLVLGIEADIALSTNKRSIDIYADGTDFYRSRITSIGTVRGRLGYAWDRALFYVTGGYAYGRVRNTAIYNNDPTESLNMSTGQSGYAVGAGIEYAMTPNWTTALIARLGVNYKF